MIAREKNIGKGLIIPHQDIIARLELFNQVALQQQRLALRMGMNKHHITGFRDHALQPDRQLRDMAICHDPFFQRLGFPDIKCRSIMR